MKCLKDYIELQKFTGISDMEIIISYFIDNNMEEDGMQIAYNLAKEKIEKMKHRDFNIKEWVYNIPSDYLYKNYPLEIADMLHRVELDYIVNGKVTGYRLKWAEENIPNIKTPTVYFVPCMEWLEEHDIKFKEE